MPIWLDGKTGTGTRVKIPQDPVRNSVGNRLASETSAVHYAGKKNQPYLYIIKMRADSASATVSSYYNPNKQEQPAQSRFDWKDLELYDPPELTVEESTTLLTLLTTILEL